MMRVAAVITVAICAMVQPCTSWSIGPMTPEAWELANKNWNATMASYYQNRNANSAGNGSCTKDMRTSMPACVQYEADWCWATGVAELASFYNSTMFPSKDNSCKGIECQVVGYKEKGDVSYCCNNTKFCGDDKSCCRSPFVGGYSCEDKCRGFAKKVDGTNCVMETCKLSSGGKEDIVKAAVHFTGQQYIAKYDGPLSQTQLDAVMAKGHPVIIAVMWTIGGGHALTIAGCGGGAYYLHDPMDKAGAYQTLTFDQIATYTPPWGRSYRGQWFGTFYPQGDLPVVEESLVV